MTSPIDDFIDLDIKNSDLFLRLPIIPRAIRDEAGDKIAEYLLSELQNPPPYRYISRKAAYGVSFFTEKQRGWFFANLNSGELQIPYQRTGTLEGGWKITGQGIETVLINDVPYAGLAYGENQSRHLAKIGWKKIPEFLRARRTAIRNVIAKEVGSAIGRALRGLFR